MRAGIGWFAAAISLVSWHAVAGPEGPDQVQHAAGPCTLSRLAALDITTQPSGAISVPVSVGERNTNFIVSLGGTSAITDAVATDLRLSPYYPFNPYHGGFVVSMMGLPAILRATVPDLQIGTVRSQNVDLYIVGLLPRGRVLTLPDEPSVGGVLSADILGSFDVELDFKAGKLNLYAPAHCGASSVFWADSYASVPIEFDETLNVRLHMALDGKDVLVEPVLGPIQARMGTVAAERILGIKEDSPGMKAVTDRETKMYRYPFKELSAGGLIVKNPAIAIVPDEPRRCDGKRHGFHICWPRPDLSIGLAELRQLHLFFAFKDKMLYLTAADAHR